MIIWIDSGYLSLDIFLAEQMKTRKHVLCRVDIQVAAGAAHRYPGGLMGSKCQYEAETLKRVVIIIKLKICDIYLYC